MKLSTIFRRPSLQALFKPTSAHAVEALDSLEITGVVEDSRLAKPGTLFVASAGEHVDGHAFIPDAVARGAVAVIGTQPVATVAVSVPYFQVADARKAAAWAAHVFHGEPSRDLQVIGVTGTNGKTSTVHLIHHILQAAGHRVAQFGTLGYVFEDGEVAAAHTTPFGTELAALFARARDTGHSHVVMEVSSHALAQERVAGIYFDCAAFTNLTQDHLDFHGDMESYCQAKLLLFERLPAETGLGVVNLEDPTAPRFRSACAGKSLGYGKGGDCRASKVRLDFSGTHFNLMTPWGKTTVSMRLLGRHNMANALCAATVCGGLGVALEDIAEGLGALEAVPGRFEAVICGQPFYVVVDYAHTDDGLKNVLMAARKLTEGEVIVVFGCGGDRDRGKRPKMGAVAAELADFCVLTSDNPRTEDPHRILLDIEVGMQRMGKSKHDDYLVIEDREEAIHTAIRRAKSGDLVLIAGKGHEDYQIRGTERLHFDDRETARKLLGER